MVRFLALIVAGSLGAACGGLCWSGENPAAGFAGPTAQELMIRAHRARAQWTDFPGFEADVVVRVNHRQVRRRVRVTAQLELEWDLALPPEFASAQRRLRSIVDHRRGGERERYDVEFVPEKGQHPLGRLIRFRQDAMHSQYRIRGDVITQVSRQTEKVRFTITVLDVVRNGEQKYLPRLYTVSFWSHPGGQLTRTSTVLIQWERVGRWDLPRLVRSVTTGSQGQYSVEVIRLQNHRLLRKDRP